MALLSHSNSAQLMPIQRFYRVFGDFMVYLGTGTGVLYSIDAEVLANKLGTMTTSLCNCLICLQSSFKLGMGP